MCQFSNPSCMLSNLLKVSFKYICIQNQSYLIKIKCPYQSKDSGRGASNFTLSSIFQIGFIVPKANKNIYVDDAYFYTYHPVHTTTGLAASLSLMMRTIQPPITHTTGY